jgi:hypothetical protein
VISTNALTETVDFTKYAVPISFERTVTLAELFKDCVDMVGEGAVVSITIVSDVAVPTLVAASDCFTETVHVPSTRVPRSQVEPPVDPAIEQTTSD